MKKLFSIVLVAAGMFMSANAGVVTDPAQLEAALNAGGTVQLGGANEVFEITSTISITTGATVELDLNGHNLVMNQPQATDCYVIRVKHGNLTVTNSLPATGGSVLNNTPNFGTTKDDRQVVDVPKYKNEKGYEIVCFSVEGSATPTDANYSVLKIASEVTVATREGKAGIIINAQNKNATVEIEGHKHKVSWGAVVRVAGKVYGDKYGIQVSGNVNAGRANLTDEGINCEGFAFPILEIASTADVSSNPTAVVNGNGVYCGGFAIVTINGYVHGSNGVYVKSSEVTIEDAHIESENPNYTEVVGKKSGSEGSGNAIVIESNAGYNGGAAVTVSGDSKIEAASGFAIQETITTAAESNVEEINIQGGTFIAGEQGGIIMTEKTVEDEVVKVSDANLEGFTAQEVTDLIGGGSNNFIVTTEDGTVVVCSGTAPSWKSGDLANDNGDYQWTTAKTQNIESDINVGFFDMEKGTVDVKAGKTLTVNRLVMGPEAKIVVEVGGRLIVDGNMGIVANDAENITIQAQENNMGQFLFNPAVNSNRHPNATIVFNSKAWGVSASENQVQLFGCPMTSVTNVTSSSTTYKSQFDVAKVDGTWDKIGVINATTLDYSKFNKAFGIYCITSNNPENAKLSYTFQGSLLGNTQPEGFKILKGWTTAANSWTGDADPNAMINELASLGCTNAVYTYKQQGNALIWTARNSMNALEKVEPMQPIMFNNESGSVKAHEIMNYENLVWNFRQGAAAPARATDFTKAAIRIANANGFGDEAVVAENDAQYSAPKYPNEVIRVYVSADQEYDIFATNNVENTYVGFNCVEAGTYTVSFDGIQGDNLVLVDLVNNREIAIVEGAEYQFEAKANTINPAHFQVRKVAEVATNVENAAVQNDIVKTIVNDQVVIIRNGVRYNTVGQRL